MTDFVLPAVSKKFHALVVGIDRYELADGYTLQNLKGCVADAIDIVRFLREEYRVPESQITLLLNEHATRTRIINGIRDFVDLERFEYGDLFFIYFAGHAAQVGVTGGTAQATGEDSGDVETTEMLLPYGFAPWTSDREDQQGIPNSTLGPLLKTLNASKGPNIVVVLDCCHSSYITRPNKEGKETIELQEAADDTETESDVAVRAVVLADDYSVLPAVLDRNPELEEMQRKHRPWISPHSPPVSSFISQMRGDASHVLLTACGRNETAKERWGRGQFTRALTDYLRDPYIDPAGITFRDVIESLPKLKGQTPHAYGLPTIQNESARRTALMDNNPSDVTIGTWGGNPRFASRRDRFVKRDDINVSAGRLGGGQATFDGCVIV